MIAGPSSEGRGRRPERKLCGEAAGAAPARHPSERRASPPERGAGLGISLGSPGIPFPRSAERGGRWGPRGSTGVVHGEAGAEGRSGKVLLERGAEERVRRGPAPGLPAERA